MSSFSNISCANEIIYCGYRSDPESQLYYVRNRTYNPVLGRWIQRDPIGYQGGINLYGYVESSPIGSVDALGLVTKKFNLEFTGQTAGFQGTSPEGYGSYYVPGDKVHAGVKFTASASQSWAKTGQGESFSSLKFTQKDSLSKLLHLHQNSTTIGINAYMIVGEIVEKSVFDMAKTTHSVKKGPNSPGGPEDAYDFIGTWTHETFLKIGTYVPFLVNYFMHSWLVKTTVVSHFDIGLTFHAVPGANTSCKSIAITAKVIK